MTAADVIPLNERPQVLYRMHDKDGQLLYIGITTNIGTRISSHHGTQTWWNDVSTISLEQFTDRPSVEEAERAAISAERPLFNSTYQARPADRRRHPTTIADEVSLVAARANFAEIVNQVAVHGRTIYLTNRGRRIAALVPVAIAEDNEPGDQDSTTTDPTEETSR